MKAKKSEVKKSSALYHLDPFLDQDGLIRVGGRLGNSQEFPEDLKHPKKSFIVDLIVCDAHTKVAHAGRGIMLNELRSQYWIVKRKFCCETSHFQVCCMSSSSRNNW